MDDNLKAKSGDINGIEVTRTLVATKINWGTAQHLLLLTFENVHGLLITDLININY